MTLKQRMQRYVEIREEMNQHEKQILIEMKKAKQESMAIEDSRKVYVFQISNNVSPHLVVLNYPKA